MRTPEHHGRQGQKHASEPCHSKLSELLAQRFFNCAHIHVVPKSQRPRSGTAAGDCATTKPGSGEFPGPLKTKGAAAVACSGCSATQCSRSRAAVSCLGFVSLRLCVRTPNCLTLRPHREEPVRPQVCSPPLSFRLVMCTRSTISTAPCSSAMPTVRPPGTIHTKS
jgi:hypothetical protein